MRMFTNHKLIEDENGNTLILYLNPDSVEFAKELGSFNDSNGKDNIKEKILNYIKANLKNAKINTIKIMMGSLMITTIPFASLTTKAEAASSAAVQTVGQQYKVTVNGRIHNFSHSPANIDGTIYVPLRDIAEVLGAEIWWNGESKTVGINKGNTKIAFIVGSSSARINGNKVSMQPSYIDNGVTMVPLRFIGDAFDMSVNWDQDTGTVTISGSVLTYTVKSGDTLWKIANQYNTTVDQIKQKNKLSSDMIYIGQKLNIVTEIRIQVPDSVEENSISYMTYTIQRGDNMWDLSIKYGIPMTELLNVNKMTENSSLAVGQKIIIPVHKIAVKQTAGERYGEYLDWWTEAQYVFPINKTATVTDFQTGRSFRVKRTIGAFHADCEPLTAADAAIIKEIWGGSYSWKERAVIVQVDGRKIAASMASMPHDIDYIKDNNFNGHFDIHFKNSTRHKDGLVSEAHQAQIRIAAGISK